MQETLRDLEKFIHVAKRYVENLVKRTFAGDNRIYARNLVFRTKEIFDAVENSGLVCEYIPGLDPVHP